MHPRKHTAVPQPARQRLGLRRRAQRDAAMGMIIESSEDARSSFKSGVAATAVQDDTRIRRFFYNEARPFNCANR